ncbi:prepilin-type N-terminal cleavage/methylation domain-containing protein (plasmid) [Deinococcus sp. KNUC1210]|uniref:PilW family protein n=1 Tax=Deinococcus sp. KNUC1210 TaxID=2917691 RepID=UPI001EF15900|nr:prepilin-type N-terminal cleavage/methylation domain-containing protein [Deinococcus sp. KNUC1210]ULH14156.1 prepilin-type N-terminal cleavage/methylation domain-containing protein [Deinococcus sp. KNUC1210]
MLPQPHPLSRTQGFTLIEVLVTVSLLTLVLGIVLSTTTSTLSLYRTDQARLTANRDSRSTLDILGNDVRQAGERLTADFPAISVSSDTAGNSVLTLRRSLIDGALPLCAPIPSAGGLYVNANNSSAAVFSGTTISNLPDACTTSLQNLTAWNTAIAGGNVTAYLYDVKAGAGDFVTLTGTTQITSSNSLLNNGQKLNTLSLPTRTYDPRKLTQGDAGRDIRVYLIEERRYYLEGGVLKLMVNNAPAVAAVPNVQSFKVTPYLSGSPVTVAALPFPVLPSTSTTWKSLAYLDVTLTIKSTSGTKSIQRSTTQRYTPRNASSADQ